jgi:PAP2 superfamily
MRSKGSILVLTIVAAASSVSGTVRADAVTDWNLVTIEATKAFTGSGSTGLALNSNLASRIAAIEARAVFDAINAITHFSERSYYYTAEGTGSVEAAAVQAAHDVILAQLPDPTSDASVDPKWTQTRAWVDEQLARSLATLGVPATDAGIAVGKAAALAANTARSLDNARPVLTYGAQLLPTTNPGVGIWRQSNAAAPYIDPPTGAPTGFDATGTIIQGRPGIDLNWRDVAPFSLSIAQQLALIADVPLSPSVDSLEYREEREYVRRHGQYGASARDRSSDQTAQALFYKQDAELFVNELARSASQAYGLGLEENAALFALLDGTLADARIAAFSSKYQQKFWRPITALNADADGTVRNNYTAWRPLAATPSHPSNTAGHSTTGAAGAEILRAFFASDRVRPDGAPVQLGTLSYLVGTNSGTGKTTTRSVSTFSQVQLENGASRLYLGVHFGFDNLQGQLLGLAVADTILLRTNDPAATGLRPRESSASLRSLTRTLLARPDLYGYFGRDSSARGAR